MLFTNAQILAVRSGSRCAPDCCADLTSPATILQNCSDHSGAQMAEQSADNESGVRVIPPLIFLVAMTGAFLNGWFWPLRTIPNALQYPLVVVVILISFAPMPGTIAAFRKAETTFDVRR